MRSRAAALARSARGYLPGFGTSGSLLAGAALMFVLANALVAFRGWPHVGAQPSPGEVVVSPSPTAAAGSPANSRLALFSTLTAGAGGAAARGGAAAGPVRPAGVRRKGTARPQHALGAPASTAIPVGGSGAGTGASPAPACGTACGFTAAPVQPGSLGSGPAQPVQQVVKQASGALGGVLEGTGRQVGSVVQQTTGAVSGAVQPVSPPVAGAVNRAGAGAGRTVTGVTKTIAGALSGLTKH
jgi:hypothetical protein